MVIEQKIKEYVAALASAAPTPGGGSASAITALLGISMMEMAVELTKNKKNFASYEAEYSHCLQAWEELKEKIAMGAEEDAFAFSTLMDVYKKPFADNEKELRQKMIDDASDHAGRVPLHVARAIVSALRNGEQIANKINPWVLSDLIGGVELSYGALRSVLLNTAININGIENKSMKEQLYKEMIAMHHEGEEAYRGLRALLYEDPIFEALNDN